MAQANWQHQHGQSERAEIICSQILAREPGHVHALNLLGLISQEAGRHRAAAKALTRAVASDPFNAACHYNLANSYQALGRADAAAAHFKKVITFGARQNNIEKLILQNPIIAACVDRIEAQWPLLATSNDVLVRAALQEIANDIFLRCALTTIPIRGVALERFLTLVRSALLGFAHGHIFGAKSRDDDLAPLLTAIAQQCFINEYIFAQSDEETRQSIELRDLLLRKSAAGGDIEPLLLAAVAAYFPPHALPAAEALAARHWPGSSAELLRQALREPLEELEDCKSIPSLTDIDDSVSLQVQQQYQQNPYPRWTIDPLAAFAADRESWLVSEPDNPLSANKQILIAGCGSGQHAIETARQFPESEMLAVDISLPSLAYARRKTREAGLGNIEYARADILKLATVGRSFDRIEAVGVLHHLADPEHGWRILLSLLRPDGDMRIGLYSEQARRAITNVRTFIAARGYRPTVKDIRQCRQDVLRDCDERGWLKVIESADFYSMSGCRDLLFNIMEHRFTIPRIKAFLSAQNLAFLGFDAEPWIATKFQQQFGADALTDLDTWDAFEAANPTAFRYMYVFTVRKI
jgi:SAM-dependent methyltransferase/tetratricopeptide (TPR) repeat protein